MFVILAFLASLASAALTGQTRLPVTEVAPIAITGVTVIDVIRGRHVPRQTVVLNGQRIVAAGHRGRVRIPGGAQVVDGRGRFLIPGLIDTHVHLGWDLDSAATRALLPHFLAAGVTTVREASSRSTVPEQIFARGEVCAGRMVGPRIVVSGRIDARAVRRAGASTPAEVARMWAAMGVDGLKIRSGLTAADVLSVVAEGKRLGLPVFGHTVDIEVSYAAQAITAGLSGVMHVEPLARDLPLVPGAAEDAAASPSDVTGRAWRDLVRWTLVDSAAEEALATLMVLRGVWLEPTLAISAASVFPERWRGDPRRARLPRVYAVDAADTTKLPIYRGDSLVRARAAFTRMMRFVRRVHELGGVVLAGTDGEPVPAWAIHDELALLVEAGLSPAAALRAATVDAARILGLSGTTGAVAVGLAADLVLLDADPLTDIKNTQRIRTVFANGRLFERAAQAVLLSPVAGFPAVGCR